jgi:cytochrome c oxidase subunit 3
MSTIAANCTQQGAGSVTPPGSYDFGDFGGDDSARLLRRYRLGLGLCVCAIVMVFVGLTSAYVVRRGIPAYDPASGAYSTSWEPLRLPLALLVVNTMLLVAASLTIEVARRASLAASCVWVPKKESHSAQVWSLSSLLLLAGFIAGQALVWQQLRASGEFSTSGARTAFFYVVTGTHAAHAVFGLFLVAWIVLSGLAHRSDTRRYITTDMTAWYLHSMTALWIYLFAFLLFG